MPDRQSRATTLTRQLVSFAGGFVTSFRPPVPCSLLKTLPLPLGARVYSDRGLYGER